ncbi:hypothetical protein JB92DRAFT_2965900, partial [Gautieria morchelliformis]
MGRARHPLPRQERKSKVSKGRNKTQKKAGQASKKCKEQQKSGRPNKEGSLQSTRANESL